MNARPELALLLYRCADKCPLGAQWKATLYLPVGTVDRNGLSTLYQDFLGATAEEAEAKAQAQAAIIQANMKAGNHWAKGLNKKKDAA